VADPRGAAEVRQGQPPGHGEGEGRCQGTQAGGTDG
jgi:hypothetical protein